MCHPGQFEEGRTLVVGIRKSLLAEDAIFHLKIGKKTYEALTSDLRTRKATPDVRKGVNLLIMPLYYFELVHDENWKKAPEIPKKPESTQMKLL